MPYTELYHHGILGQKWGVRRFQNKDGSLTNAGRLRYGVREARDLASYITEPLRNRAGRLRSGIQETRDLASYITEPLRNRTTETIVTGLWKADDAYKSLKTSAATLSNEVVQSASAIGQKVLSKLGLNKSMDDVYADRVVSITEDGETYNNLENYKKYMKDRARREKEFYEEDTKLKRLFEEERRQDEWDHASPKYAKLVLDAAYDNDLRDISKMTPDRIDSVYGSLVKKFNNNFTSRTGEIYEMLEGRRQALDIAQQVLDGPSKLYPEYKPLPGSETKYKMDQLKLNYGPYENVRPHTDPDIIRTDAHTFDARENAFASGKSAGSQIKTMSDAVNCCYELSTINSILDQYYSGRPSYEADHKPRQINRNISG